MPFIGKTPTRVPLTSADIQDGAIQASDLASGVGKDINWQSTIVTGSTLSAVAGNGYWINTTSNTCTITLPSSASVGDQIVFSDYARKWGTNAITINANGLNYQGYTSSTGINPSYNTDGQSVSIVYSGSTQGWIPTTDDDVAWKSLPPPYNVEYLVVAGGGSGGRLDAGGGGAGGLLTNFGGSAITFNVGTTYTVTVGAGGSGLTTSSDGNDGNDSVLSGTGISTITAFGGGGGGSSSNAGRSGGSGGGAATYSGTGGTGTVGQGNNGGSGAGVAPPAYGAGGGGGAGAVGANGTSSKGGNGGNGLSNSITGSAIDYAGGGGGFANDSNANGGTGGTGGGGNGTSYGGTAGTGTANTGGGGGGSVSTTSGAGGSGIVILRMLATDYSGTTTGSPTVTDDGSYKVVKFTGSGTYTG